MWIGSYSGYTTGELYINGSNFDVSNVVGNNTSPVLVDLGVTSLTSFGVRGNQNIRFSGLVVDGRLLVDQGVSVTNVPSIASTVRSSPESGFSIVSWSGSGSAATIGHSLNTEPELLIIKNRDAANQWPVYLKVLGAGNKLQLNTTDPSASTGHFNSTDPTSSVFSVGTTSSANNNGDDIIAYCFAPVSCYSAMGSFEGNGASSDGPFIPLSFSPAWILLKNVDNYGTNYDWCIYDNTRSTFNPANKFLCPNLSNQENVRGDGNTDNARYVDFLSNGFKIRNNSSPLNLTSHTIIYVAFASNPFKFARAV
jgi:hypothetical protein